ncbi:hypothetical protein B0H12DRAFT_1230978 [Mycena haematopus]|nr:hypothetical protein B0H12DRAFT_1230978 [Mycena haematopus]
MRSFTASIVAAVLLAALTVKGDIIAWSGNSCNGDEGANVACNGACIAFDGRHSFEVRLTRLFLQTHNPQVVTGGSHCVVMFEDDGCVGETFQFGPETEGNCINVNTGTPIGSFTCSPNSSCVFAKEANVTALDDESQWLGNFTLEDDWMIASGKRKENAHTVAGLGMEV